MPDASDETEKVLAPKQLFNLLNAARRAASQRAEIDGELGNSLKRWQDSHGLHLGAFGVIKRLDAMDSLRREQFLRALELYLDYCDENERWPRHTGDLEDRATAEAEAEQEAMAEKRAKKAKGKKAKKRKGGKVVPFERPADVDLSDERGPGDGPHIVQ